jgi:hypothetical protein
LAEAVLVVVTLLVMVELAVVAVALLNKVQQSLLLLKL